MRGKSVSSLIGVSFILILTLITLVAACAKPAPTPAKTPAPAPATTVAPAKPPAPATTPAPAVKPAAKEIVWRLLSWVGKDEVANAPAMALIKKVNDALKGEFQIEFKGGPEVVKPTDIAQAVLNKVGEIGHVPPTYYTSILPLNTSVMLTNLPYDDIRKSGWYQFNDQLHQAKGLTFLGQVAFVGWTFHFFTKLEVKKLSDLEGKKIRVIAANKSMVDAVKGVPVTMALGDVYTAMERGTIDVTTMTAQGVVSMYHLNEVAKYVITPGVFDAKHNLMANLDSWNQLPQSTRTKLTDIFIKIEPEWRAWSETAIKKQWEDITGSGMKIIALPPADGDKFVKDTYELAWKDLLAKDATNGAKMKAMLLK